MIKIFKVFVPTSVITLLLCEAVILFGCYLGGLYLAAWLFEGPTFIEEFLLDYGLLRLSFVVATIMLGLYFNDLYESFHISSRIQLVQQVCLAVGVAFLAQAFMGYLLSGWIVPRYTMIIGSSIVLIVIPPWRMVYVALVFRALGAERVLFLGSSPTLKELAEGLKERPTMGLKLVGFLDDGAGGDDPFPGVERMGTIQDLKNVLNSEARSYRSGPDRTP